MFSKSKNGVAAKEIERQLGVTYKCAWRICNRVRQLIADDVSMLDGEVEIDENSLLSYGSILRVYDKML